MTTQQNTNTTERRIPKVFIAGGGGEGGPPWRPIFYNFFDVARGGGLTSRPPLQRGASLPDPPPRAAWLTELHEFPRFAMEKVIPYDKSGAQIFPRIWLARGGASLPDPPYGGGASLPGGPHFNPPPGRFRNYRKQFILITASELPLAESDCCRGNID